MSPAAAYLLALVLAVLAAAGGLLPDRWRSALVGAGTAAAVVAGVTAVGGDVGGGSFAVSLPGVLPLFGVRFALDPLAGLFVAVTGGVAVAAGIYGVGYGRHQARPTHVVLPLFVATMLLVPAAASVGAFAACWELMALTSLLLVLAEHRQRDEVRSAGLWYAVMTHLGFLAVLIGLVLFAAHAADDSFAALRSAAPGLSPAAQGTVFVLAGLGFGAKAGMVPLHAWLPRAHPEAPSHVSALMSAAMVNLGVYGLVRLGFDLLGGGARWWWLLVLGSAAVSALYGILQAAVGTDLKRLLAYSTTENMGLVGLGVGAAGLFATSGERVLAGLALAAALLHVVNHAAFKTALFLAAGSVLHGTGTSDLDALGGLRARMPATAAVFAVGALCASALPPGNAFVSEWLLLQSLVHGLGAAGVLSVVTMPLAVAVVALTAGLAVATFVKAFGTGFLAKPRSDAAAGAHEATGSMRAGMWLAAGACLVLAVAPALVLPGLVRVIGTVVGGDPVAADAISLRLNGFAGSLSPLLLAVAVLGAVLAVGALLRLAAQRRMARLWDCGGGPMTARMEYTATSFAEPLARVFDDVLEPEHDVDVTHAAESAYLVESVQYRRRVPDRIEARLYRPVLAAAAAWGQAGRKLATGSVHRYLGYGFYTVTALLLVLAVTR
jgi:formate hydrogenlyase subunit 3/multisubunit Na+/H+ antiporter MnhD subunit